MSSRRLLLPSAESPGLPEIHRVTLKLCDLWDKSVDKDATFRPELDERRAIGIHTLTHHAVRMSRAVLAVDDATNGGLEVAPCVRAVMESAVTAAWLLLTPGSGDTLIRDGAGQRKKALDEMIELGHDAGPAYAQVEATLKVLEDGDGPRSFQFQQRCLALEGGRDIYLTYRVWSAQSHAGLGIMDHYSVEDESSPIGMAFHPHNPLYAREATVGTSACMLLLAINAHELALAKPTHTTQIREAAKALGVGTRVARRDGTEMPARKSKAS